MAAINLKKLAISVGLCLSFIVPTLRGNIGNISIVGYAFDEGALAAHKVRVADAIDYDRLTTICAAEGAEAVNRLKASYNSMVVTLDKRLENIRQQQSQIDQLLALSRISGSAPNNLAFEELRQKARIDAEENERKVDLKMQTDLAEQTERAKREAFSGCDARFHRVAMTSLDSGLVMAGIGSSAYSLLPLIFDTLRGGSVYLNNFGAIRKWNSASFMLPPGLATLH